MKPRRIALVEDDPFTVDAVRKIVSETDGMVFVGCAASAREAEAILPDQKPDVVIVDYFLSSGNGIGCVERLVELLPGADILFFTVMDQADVVLRAIQAGASGYLLKSSGYEALRDAVRSINQGGSPMTPSVARHLIREFQNAEAMSDGRADLLCQLTDKERTVLQMLVSGMSYKDIAAGLDRSSDTVRNHVSSIYKKLQLKSRHEAKARFGRLLKQDT